MVAQLMRDIGCAQAPMNAYILNLGLESLHLRMKRHCENALIVAKYLDDHPKIGYVNCPMLSGSPYHELARKYLPEGACGVIGLGVRGGREAAEKFLDSLRLAHIATHVSDAHSCVLHPASTTHRQMTDAELAAAGIRPDYVRYSVGLENARDILADLEQALAKI
jgi:O-acetylhomoserine (thiol)-lyase